MKFYLLMIPFSFQLVIALVGENECDQCQILTNEDDCNVSQLHCEFDNSNQVCMVKPLNNDDCKYHSEQYICDLYTGCAWNNQGQCSIFTGCSNYIVKDPHECYSKDPSCIPGDQNKDKLTTCMVGQTNCQDIKEEQICWGKQSSESTICLWDQSCVQQDISKCDTITDAFLCEVIGCKLYYGNCQSQKCEDINSKISCTYIPISFVPWKTQICEWTRQGCKDAIDTSAFTEYNCLVDTGQTYHWDQLTQTCQECPGEASSQSNSSKTLIIILSVFIPVVIIIIICLIYICLRKSRRNIQNRQQRIEQNLNPLDIYCPNLEYQDIKDKNEIQCSICLQNFEKDSKVKVTYCNHIYHSNCLIAWMEKNKDCPLCRASLELRILKQKNEMQQQNQKQS